MNRVGAGATPKIGFVVIGRNEAARLGQCLASVQMHDGPCVYVDSASKDASCEIAEQLGVPVLQLCPDEPLSAARARNAGFDWLTAQHKLDYVQFIDGDTELRQDWIAAASAHMQTRPSSAVAFGWRKERSPEAHIYNRLAEWDCPDHRAKASRFAGDAFIRVEAFWDARGFNSGLIAGEEADLCRRLEQKGWQIDRLDREMSLHDLNMTRFSEWWRRMRRGGFAFAQNAMVAPAEPGALRQMLSALFWGTAVPSGAVGLVVASELLFALGLVAIYPINILRMAFRMGASQRISWERSTFLMLGKLPECLGVKTYFWRRIFGGKHTLIEYK